ncbi:TetR/AcrR family transcriptional regulator [Streptomyces gilvifuscus]|uniref:TetR/AcrR family transcriptional regulator n=1 Tax=Streptomyces gilvifuscus TaxID=1550617 RepID=A0ABT5FRN3_9ACTN|nr:TetR/AcrR family transcriptional regulator [Streptomyces gilvifuscus]MDC2955151.1 TetR/AcrR family transcriptional regulator [Streptomyces gilvifuscus]
MPTGVAIRDPRQQLFDAAERILLRDGPSALTSRAVTAEAGCAKGVLHRHFADFDAFLAELVLGRIGRLDAVAEGLRAAAGTGSVTDHLTGALAEVFDAVGVAVVSLVIARDELRARLRAAGCAAGIPLLTEAAAMLASYLAAERDLGRVAPGADPAVLAPTLLGAAHLLYADRESPAPDTSAVRAVVTTVMASALR